ncbi:MAG: tetratricopeptide repeat protein [Anaerolineae bacterium]|nr:tetratricopeptide repeat protein [Anaerolineae bacterium]
MPDTLFTGREAERRFFRSMLEGHEPTRVLAISGMGGIGKTELLKQFQRMATEWGIASARVDETVAGDIPRLLDAVAQQIEGQGVRLDPLTGKLREYKRIKTLLTLAPRAPTLPTARTEQWDLGAVHKLILDAFTDKSLRRFCQHRADLRPVLALVGSEAGLADLADELIEYCRTQVLLDKLLAEIEQENPRQYEIHRDRLASPSSAHSVPDSGAEAIGSIQDVLKAAELELYQAGDRFWMDQFCAAARNADQPLLLLCDSYEKIQDHDPWLRDLAEALAGEPVWMVLAGQVRLDTRWAGVPGVRRMSLDSLSIEGSHEFLERIGVSGPGLQTEIVQFAGGVPLALYLAADLVLNRGIRSLRHSSEKHEIVNQLLERMLSVANSQETEILFGCAIPRMLTVPLIQYLLPGRDAAAILKDLHRRPYIVYRGDLPAVHDSIREFACARLQLENRPLFTQLQQAAIAYYDEEMAATAGTRRELGPNWHVLAIERLYHALQLDRDHGAQYFEDLFWKIDGRFQFTECLNLSNAFLSFTSDNEHFRNVGYVHKAYALFELNRWSEARILYLQVVDKETNPRILSFALGELGRTLSAVSRWKEAQKYLEEAISLNRETGNEYGLGLSLTSLGNVHTHLHTARESREIELFTEALAIFDRLGRTYRRAEVLQRLCFSHRLLGHWETVERYAQEALELSQKAQGGKYRATFQRARILDVLAHMYRDRGFFLQAEECARGALGLYRSLEHDYWLMDGLHGMAHAAILRDHPGEARACLDEALNITERIDAPFATAVLAKTSGQLAIAEGRLEDAQAAFEEHLQVMQENHQDLRVAIAHHLLGDLFRQQHDWTRAKQHLRLAIYSFYCRINTGFRAADALRLFGLILVEEGFHHGGVQLLRFALGEAEKHGLLHVHAQTHLSLAQTLLDESASNREAIQRHLIASAKLAEEQDYNNIIQEVAQLEKRLHSPEAGRDGICFVTQVSGGEVGKIVNIGSAEEVNF